MQNQLTLRLNSTKPNNAADSDDIKQFYKRTVSIEDLLVWCTETNCSDLYIKVFEKPFISRFGKIVRLPCTEITKDMWATFYDKYVLNELNASYVRSKMLDSSVEIRIPESSENFGKFEDNYYRYRVAFGFSEEKNIATFRMIRPDKPTFETINFDKQCEDVLHKICSKHNKINFITGPTGSGKSTSLAACINSFTTPEDVLDNEVIITLEDPIENKFSSTASTKITQKELGVDFKSFALGIKLSLREHPTKIIVGECRDKEVVTAAIDASRTGHGVFTTVHSSDVAGTITRLLYYLDNDKNLSYDLITNTNLIMSQRLLKSNNKYIVDTQYVIFTDDITKRLIAIIEEDLNIHREVQKIIKNQEYVDQNIVKDWTYSQ